MNRFSLLHLVTAFSCLFLGWFFLDFATIDIPVHDTYFVISVGHISWGVSLVYFFWSVFYFLVGFYRSLNPKLIWIHFVLTILSIVFMLYPMSLVGLARAPRRYYDSNSFLDYVFDLNFIVSIFVILFIIAQLLPIIALIFSKRKAKL